MEYIISADDIKQRIYFIIKLTQSHNSPTMQGILTSKSDYIGGIFDRFINSITEDILFDKVIIPEIDTNKKVEVVKDYYLYMPNKNGAGIAPDVFGLKVNDKIIPFVEFNEKWKPIDNMPQIEVKTFKEKDQMISLRNQDYDSEYLVLADLNLRIDYLVPFFNKDLLNTSLATEMEMNDDIFIKSDTQSKIKKITPIDYSSNKIGKVKLISITNGGEFINQATLCKANIGPRRMKEIKKRQINIKESLSLKLSDFANQSPRISALYEFNDEWYAKTNINKEKSIYLDFSAKNIEDIEIVRINKSSIIIKALNDDCSFNDVPLEKYSQYVIYFETLDRSGNSGEEYFMQKQCAKYLTSLKEELLSKFEKLIETN